MLLGVSAGSVPSSSASFFCRSMMCSARRKRVRNCSFSWRSLAISAAWGSGFGPRFCGVSACRPRVRAACATCQGATNRALPAAAGADLAPLGAGIGLGQDALLVFGTEPSTLGLR